MQFRTKKHPHESNTKGYFQHHSPPKDGQMLKRAKNSETEKRVRGCSGEDDRETTFCLKWSGRLGPASTVGNAMPGLLSSTHHGGSEAAPE
eukprot:3060319-Amphidinium_carterae.1